MPATGTGGAAGRTSSRKPQGAIPARGALRPPARSSAPRSGRRPIRRTRTISTSTWPSAAAATTASERSGDTIAASPPPGRAEDELGRVRARSAAGEPRPNSWRAVLPPRGGGRAALIERFGKVGNSNRTTVCRASPHSISHYARRQRPCSNRLPLRRGRTPRHELALANSFGAARWGWAGPGAVIAPPPAVAPIRAKSFRQRRRDCRTLPCSRPAARDSPGLRAMPCAARRVLAARAGECWPPSTSTMKRRPRLMKSTTYGPSGCWRRKRWRASCRLLNSRQSLARCRSCRFEAAARAGLVDRFRDNRRAAGPLPRRDEGGSSAQASVVPVEPEGS